MNSQTADVNKKTNRHQLEIKNKAVCDMIEFFKDYYRFRTKLRGCHFAISV